MSRQNGQNGDTIPENRKRVMSPTSPDRLTAPQLRKIWAIARGQLEWDALRLHDWLDVTLGKRHVSELDRDEARRVIDRLEGLVRARAGWERTGAEGFGYREARTTVDAEGRVVEYCTKAQLAKLRALAGRHDWGDGWLRQVIGRSLGREVAALEGLRFKEAMRAINVVEGLVISRSRRKDERGRND